ncbi:MAG: ABC transporter ATP-binding protein [Candidatus Poribacteria bacterium]|nr:ABC transporter ATP-binding protein [Candidatus Poribacteria bacterium]
MLELSGVSKTFGQTRAVQRMDLNVEAGQTTVLIGPSGCGKSTLLRLMIGLIRPDTGTIRFEGTELTPDNVLALRQRMGYVIQEGGLFPHLTGYDNVSLMAQYLGWDDNRIKARLAELTDLTHFPTDGLDRYPAQLSGGQQQRVSLMRALMLDPDVLLMDEPLGALDAMIRAGLQTDLREIFQTLGKTVVMVTHDIGEAGFFGDEILLLRDGQVVQKDTLETLVSSPAEAFVSDFINAQRSPLETLGGGES